MMKNNEERRLSPNEVSLHVGGISVFNSAMYHNGIQPIRKIQISNHTQDPIEGLRLIIQVDTEILADTSAPLPPVKPGKPLKIEDPKLRVNGEKLAALTESVITNVKIGIALGDQLITSIDRELRILTYNQWMGDFYSDYLPAFVMPNHPVVTGLIHDAAVILKKWGKAPSLEGYQSGNPGRVLELSAAAYAAIQQKNIVYAESPKGIFSEGQRIRTPEVIMADRLGTCMDMTLLYASCLEAIGLHAILYLIDGHIFAGVWLHNETFKDLRVVNFDEIKKRCAKHSEEIVFVECTAMCAGKNIPFEEAEKHYNTDGSLDPRVFKFVIDVTAARMKGIRPLFSRSMKDGRYQIEYTERKDDEITAAPEAREIDIQANLNTGKRKITSKRELWEMKLLDLSTHNMLLNLPARSVEPILSSYVGEIEDALADGEEFRLCPLPINMVKDTVEIKNDKGKTKKVPLIEFMVGINGGILEVTEWQIDDKHDFADLWRQEARSHRLYTFRTPEALDKSLTSIYRAASAAKQENGVSSLYFAVGLLRWYEPEVKEPHYAPLVLVPIEMVRKSANQGYAFHMREEESHFNLTLLEMLRQNYNIDIGNLEPLPLDDHGVDIKRIFAIVRAHLQTVPDWDVIETCVIGNFSFAQFAMWNDIHRAGEMLDKSDIVRSLMKGHVDWEIRNGDSQQDLQYLPITVDGTQLKAIQMAAEGQTFVLHGPPGTGKSQTITGMIANLMAQGKKVLFVAEKMAALSVVEKRLTSLGVGDFCLELHSDKANKKHVLSQLEKALSNLGQTRKDDFDETLRQFNLSRDTLDQYMKHLHKTRKCGYSMHDLIDLYESTSGQQTAIPFTREEVRDFTREQIRSLRPLMSNLMAAGENVGDPTQHPLRSVGLETYSYGIRTQADEVARNYLEAYEKLTAVGKPLVVACHMDEPQNSGDYQRMLKTAESALKARRANAAVLRLIDIDPTAIRQLIQFKEQVAAEKAELLNQWQDGFLSADITSILSRYDAAGKKLLGKTSALKAIAAELQAQSRQPVLIEQIPALLGRIKAWQEKEYDLSRQVRRLSPDEQVILKGVQSEDDLQQAVNQASELRLAIETSGVSLIDLRQIRVTEEEIESVHTALAAFTAAERELNRMLVCNRSSGTLAETLLLAQSLREHPSMLKDWILYFGCRSACLAAGLKPAVKAYEEGMTKEEIIPACQKGLYYALINEIISTDEVLGTFSGASFNEAVRQFKQMDDLLIQQTRTRIFNSLVERIPSDRDSVETGTELNLLRKAIGSNARGMSIRALFEKLSNIIQRLCPVMLMSPNSVAQYLERKNDMFDVVIFDEASQLPTCKAAGALARAKAAVIVGDPKQMPPTSFFAGRPPLTDDLTLDDLDSILDDALALGIPSQYLQWHYRSTHESLIAFSNLEFYGNKMFTFPSANDGERHVTAVHVDGVYSKSVNVKEAEAVVSEIIRRFRDPELKKLSIGVVTFNVKQQDMIYNLLTKQYQQNPELDAWANSGEDPLFIKNLENVQGDERDVILFSIGYGPDEKGHLSMNFGPINKAGGGKRLNVAFSRARVSMMIFASMYSSQIKVTETSPEGLIAFQAFLHYAEGNSLETPGTQKASDKEEVRRGILMNIAEALIRKGYECQTDIGHSSFHVDIAVVDPYDSTRYLMGILLDGDNYRITENTRDREIAQAGVLRRLGWTLQRVWTIDWWDNPDRQMQQIFTKVEKAKAAAEDRYQEKQAAASSPDMQATDEALQKQLETQAAEVIAEEEQEENNRTDLTFTSAAEVEESLAFSEIKLATESEPNAASEAKPEEPVLDDLSEADTAYIKPSDPDDSDAPTQAAVTPKDYRLTAFTPAELPVSPLPVSDYCAPANQAEIVRRAEILVGAEGPILRDVCIKKLMTSFGLSRATAAIEATEKALKAAKFKNVKRNGIVYCWPSTLDPKDYTEYRVGERDYSEISPHELKNVLCYTLQQQGGPMSQDDLIKEASVIMGYNRLGKNLETALLSALQFAKSNGNVTGTAEIALKM